jgi:hypothetical protein
VFRLSMLWREVKGEVRVTVDLVSVVDSFGPSEAEVLILSENFRGALLYLIGSVFILFSLQFDTCFFPVDTHIFVF